MNNKGFAITTILYGTLILFMLLLVSMLGILAAYKKNMEKLIDANNGSRSAAMIKKEVTTFATEEEIIENIKNNTRRRGLYCTTSGNCKYYSSIPE